MNEDINKELMEIDKRLKEAFDTDGQIPAPEPTEAPERPQMVDLYQAQRNDAYKASQSPIAHGSPAQLPVVAKRLVEELRSSAYSIYKNQYDHLREYNATNEAEHLRQEYFIQRFLPAVESLVEEYGVDALLNSTPTLDLLDDVVLTTNGSGKGFTRGYLNQMHAQHLHTRGTTSDKEVSNGLRKARAMADNGDIRASVSLAQKIKDKVDRGEASASEGDYSTLLQVSSYK